MELCADVPLSVGYLDNLHQAAVGIDAHTLHPCRLVLLPISIVELVTVTVSLLDLLFPTVCLTGTAAFLQFAAVGSQPHRSPFLRNSFLPFHQVNHRICCRTVQFRTVGILKSQHIPCKFDDHHLHAEADAKRGDVVGAAIFRRKQLAFRAPAPEARTDHDASHAVQPATDVVFRQVFAVDENRLHLPSVICSCMGKAFAYALIGILQVVLAHESDGHLTHSLPAALQEVAPRTERRSLPHLYAQLLQADGIQSLLLHVDRHLIDTGQVLTLDDGIHVDITEVCHLRPQAVTQLMLGAQHQHLRLYAQPLQLLHAGLRGFGLQLSSCCQIGHQGQVYVQCPPWSQFPSQLSDGFQERLALDVADGSAYLRDDEVQLLLRSLQQDAPFDFIRNMRNHLDGLPQIVAAPFTLDDTQVDAPCGDAVVACGLNAGEALVVSQVEVGLHAVGGDVALSVLVWVQRTGVDVDVGVELLDGDPVAACLQQLAQRSRDDALAQ